MTNERGIGFGFKIYVYYMYKNLDHLLGAVGQYYLYLMFKSIKIESFQPTFFQTTSTFPQICHVIKLSRPQRA